MNDIAAPIIVDTSDDADTNFEIGSDTFEVSVGQWYWVKSRRHVKGDVYEDYKWFGCCIHVGSNYLEVKSPPSGGSSYNSTRIHFDNFWTHVEYEPDHERVLAEYVANAQGNSKALMSEIRELTHRLGLQSQTGQIGTTVRPDASGTALAVMSGTDDLGQYKTELIKAKEETLPELFKKLQSSNAEVARWMAADALALEAVLNPMKASLKEIDGRIFNITLYSGLTESAAQVREGPAADVNEKLRVMQSRLYMDEECLLNYEAGGMEFSSIREFDQWLARDENFYRLLPFPRCAVAFRVRRYEKERQASDLLSTFINFQKAQADKMTFLYIRNGEQLWWIQTDLDFGENLFPDQSDFDPMRPVMVSMFGSRIDKMMTRDDYEVRLEKWTEARRLCEEWIAANPKEEWQAANPGKDWGWENPYTPGYNYDAKGDSPELKLPNGERFRPSDWKPMDQSNVYFDDYMADKKAQIDQYNRIALIIQGLFDRSMCLHPHQPVQLWNPESFASAIELIYDGSITLYHGEKPDIEAYMKRLNSMIDENSIVMGQEHAWLQREAERENAKRRRSYYSRGINTDLETYSPYGDPGPGFIGKMTEWKPRSRKAVFRWIREGQWDRWTRMHKQIPCTIEIEANRLFNISAYKPGDFRQFFLDRRTRKEYLKWAPRLLAAEDYHAGKVRNGWYS